MFDDLFVTVGSFGVSPAANALGVMVGAGVSVSPIDTSPVTNTLGALVAFCILSEEREDPIAVGEEEDNSERAELKIALKTVLGLSEGNSMDGTSVCTLDGCKEG